METRVGICTPGHIRHWRPPGSSPQTKIGALLAKLSLHLPVAIGSERDVGGHHTNQPREEEEPMKLPLEVTFRNVTRTEPLEERIRSKAAKLDHFCDRITGCRVVVESPHRHQHKGNAYQVNIEISVPGDELVVNRHCKDSHEELGIAIRDAFQAAQRQLSTYSRKRNASRSHTWRNSSTSPKSSVLGILSFPIPSTL